MALSCGVRVVMLILLTQSRDYIVGHSRLVLDFANWITIRLNYQVEVFKVFYNAHNDILPECISKSILRKRESCYSLRGQDVALIPRYNSRLMRDSLSFRGSVLWNLVNYNDRISSLNFKEIKERLIANEYFKKLYF